MNIALILAGGNGTRMKNLYLPKQFLTVNDKPIIAYTIEQFSMHLEIDKIVIVTLKDYIDTIKKIVDQYDFPEVEMIVSGGSTRQESVFKGLEAIKSFASPQDIVLIHDGVRPLIGPEIISANIDAVKNYGNCITVIPSNDSIISSKGGQEIESVRVRQEQYLVQTPQSFYFDTIYKAHLNALENGVTNATDDGQLVHALGQKIHLVMGDRLNFKITEAIDYKLFKALVE